MLASAAAGSDGYILKLLAAPVGMAVHATVLAEELQTARTRVVSAREEERRRLRRDLHDGLGSALSGIAFMADAARNYVRPQPQEAIELLTRLVRKRRTHSRTSGVSSTTCGGDGLPLTVTIDGP